MPIQLDKIMSAIAEEKVLYPSCTNADKKDTENAWLRVAKKNKISVHEVRSIYKVLQKKYEQEHSKSNSSWKFYKVMHDMYTAKPEQLDIKPEVDLPDMNMDEDEEYEVLDVQEDEEHAQQNASVSSEESVSKSCKSTTSQSNHSSPEKEDKFISTKALNITKTSGHSVASSSSQNTVQLEKKLLNTAPSAKAASSTPSNTAAALQKKGITLKKTVVSPAGNTPSSQQKSLSQPLPVEKTRKIQLPEGIKRKLAEQASAEQISSSQPAAKRLNTMPPSSPSGNNIRLAASQSLLKKDRSEERDNQPQQQAPIVSSPSTHGISVITIPNNSTLPNGITLIDSSSAANTTAASSTTAANSTISSNGYGTQLEDIDFGKDIIFEAGPAGSVSGANTNGSATSSNGAGGNRVANANDIINLGNFENSLPPTFFKNLHNSERYEALALLVSNTMSRLDKLSAAKLELEILRGILDAKTAQLEALEALEASK